MFVHMYTYIYMFVRILIKEKIINLRRKVTGGIIERTSVRAEDHFVKLHSWAHENKCYMLSLYVQSQLILKTRLKVRGGLYGAALIRDWRRSKGNMKILKCILYMYENVIMKLISLCNQYMIIKEKF